MEEMPGFSKIELLYVEDDATVMELLLKFLQRRFEVIHTARNGREGLEIFRIKKPKIVITDVQMPQMDGLEMSRFIKAESPETPVIVTSAFNEESYLKKAREIGVDKYLQKPIVIRELLDSIHEISQQIGVNP